MTNPDRLN